MRIMIIGANGFLGRKLTEYFSKKNEVIATGLHPSSGIIKLDVTNRKETESLISKFKPDVVIDTVALSSSVTCEKDPKLCKELNYITAENIAKSCKKNNSMMVFISSSYVFDGNKGDYKENDVPSPINEYAKTKIMAEKEIAKLPNFLIIRIDMLYGLEDGKIRFGTRYFDDDIIEVGFPEQIRTPVFIEDVPKIIFKLIDKEQKGIFHIAGLNKVSMFDFLIKLSCIKGGRDKIKVVDATNWIVKSPNNSSLDISKIKRLGIKTTSLEDSLSKIKSRV